MMGVLSSPPFADLSPAQDNHVNVDLPPVSEQIMQTLSELAKSFQDMADCCLLVLHLEVRYDFFKYKTLWFKCTVAHKSLTSFHGVSPSILTLIMDVVLFWYWKWFLVLFSHCQFLSTWCIVNMVDWSLHGLWHQKWSGSEYLYGLARPS